MLNPLYVASHNKPNYSSTKTGCTKQYQGGSSLEEHIMHGRHTLKSERKSTYDQNKTQWAEVYQHMS